MQNNKIKDEGIVTIAKEIRNYLMLHPDAADSLEGIVKWWLTRQRYEETVNQVQKALDILVAESTIVKRHVADGRVIYANVKNTDNKNGKLS